MLTQIAYLKEEKVTGGTSLTKGENKPRKLKTRNAGNSQSSKGEQERSGSPQL